MKKPKIENKPPLWNLINDDTSSRTWIDQFYTEIGQVQDRFNFYLVAISFLFVVFATVAVSEIKLATPVAQYIILILTDLASLVLSLYFLEINYHQCLVAQKIVTYKLNTPLPKGLIEQKVWGAIKDCFRYLSCGEFRSSGLVTPYAWLIPFGFLILWLIISGGTIYYTVIYFIH